MGKLIPSICGTTCIAWITVWSWWLSSESVYTSSENAPPATAIRIIDGDSIFTASKIFSFGLSGYKPEMPDESEEMLKKVATYLIKNPEKILTLTGEYLSMPYERNQSPFPNLGIARANAIKSVLVANGANKENIHTDAMLVKDQYVVGDRLLGSIGFLFEEKDATIAEAREVEDNGTDEPGNEEEEEDTSEDGDGENVDIDASAAPDLVFSYERKAYSLDKKHKSDLDEIRRTIKENPSYRVMITGYSTKGEEASVRDLANRRAMAIRRYLVDTGVRRKNIIVEAHPGAAIEGSERIVEVRVIK